MWKVNFGVAVAITLLPLIFLTLVAFIQSEKQRRLEEGEAIKQMLRLLTYTRLQTVHLIQERQAVLEFAVKRQASADLIRPGQLDDMLNSMRSTFGGFRSLGLYLNDGRPLAYAGPERFVQKSGAQITGLIKSGDGSHYVSEVFSISGEHYLMLAVRTPASGRNSFILSAVFDAGELAAIMNNLMVVEKSDAMVLNRRGLLQTPSRYRGNVLGASGFDIDRWTKAIDVIELPDEDGGSVLLGYADIPGTPFLLAATRPMEAIFGKWTGYRIPILVFAGVSIIVIVVVVFKGTVGQVSRLYDAYRRQTAILREIEYTNKLASVGRLAAGVAHEINNPMAIINEKAGLLQDLLKYSSKPPDRDKLLRLSDSILDSVVRVSTITHRLLGFARHLRVQVEVLDLRTVVEEVLSFLGKEARYREIHISTDFSKDLPALESDKALLEQVLLNIINNALSVINDGGKIDIAVARRSEEMIALSIADNGKGIEPENLKHVFEPFFTTKGEKGTGLGLSITYGIVKKMGGHIEVESEVGLGTCFTVVLPIKSHITENDAGSVETTIAGDPEV